MTVVSISQPAKERHLDMVRELRRMLAAAEAGLLTEMVSATLEDGNFVFTQCVATPLDSLAYATMLQANLLDRLRR